MHCRVTEENHYRKSTKIIKTKQTKDSFEYISETKPIIMVLTMTLQALLKNHVEGFGASAGGGLTGLETAIV